MSLHAETIGALDGIDPRNGVAVVTEDGRLLAERDPASDGGCVVVVLGLEPFRYPSRSAPMRADARRPAQEAASQSEPPGG